MPCGTPMDDVIDFVVETGYVAHGLEELHVAWWDPAPLLKEFKALRVKSILQAASDSLLLFDIRLGGFNLKPAETPNAIDELDLSRNSKLTELRLTLHSPKGSPEHTPVHPCTWLHALLTTITSKELTYLTIEYDVCDLDRGGHPDAALDIIAQRLTPEVASAIDALFSGEQYQGVLVDEEAWARVVRGRFPALDVRGIQNKRSDPQRLISDGHCGLVPHYHGINLPLPAHKRGWASGLSRGDRTHRLGCHFNQDQPIVRDCTFRLESSEPWLGQKQHSGSSEQQRTSPGAKDRELRNRPGRHGGPAESSRSRSLTMPLSWSRTDYSDMHAKPPVPIDMLAVDVKEAEEK
ncbi:hypothetical protein FOMPIDRAFT_1017128 [Fomitopsis schrenkii]|uniref:Uncharacterized protein n=1 Tax=Fomitopsis schrenkii TaxID=2126942 RepID=S8FCZ1_FOMSC|nr:hypothetical protein FOMPIDRAFT_1017128 [Fomitopsis schrenkii]